MDESKLGGDPLLEACLGSLSKSRLALESHAASVVILTRIIGAGATGDVIGQQLFGKAVTRDQIRWIIKKVESGELPVSEAELRTVAEGNEATKAFLERNPWLIDPTGKTVPKQRGRKPKGQVKPVVTWTPLSPVTTQTPHQPAEPAPTQEVVAPSEKPGEKKEPDWAALSKLEEENSRRRPEPKPAERRPPKFYGTPPPSVKAPQTERDTWLEKRKIELAEFIAKAKSLGWEIPADWDGFGDLSKIAVWVGTSKN